MRVSLSSMVVITTLALGACGAPMTPASDPSSSTTTTSGIVVESGPASPGDPGGAAPLAGGPRPTSGATASPMEGACDSGEPSPTASDLGSCIASCRGFDDRVPLGSTCTSARTSCIARCDAKWKKP